MNLYTPPAHRRSLFIDLLQRMLPDTWDTLLAYMAACVQHSDRRFAWAPILAGAPGNGKSSALNVLLRSVVPTHTRIVSSGDGLSSPFSDVHRARLVAVEDLPSGKNMSRVLEEVKRLMTSDSIDVQRCGKMRSTQERVLANFFITSNADVRLPAENRRFELFQCAQRLPGDLGRDGLTPEYFD